MTAMRTRYVTIRGHVIRYAVRPGDTARPPLLMLNGLGANIELAEPFIDALPGPPVVIFDVPGVGGSSAPSSAYRPAHVARLAAALLDHLGYAEADILGVSWGGAVGQQFAWQHAARCRRLVLAATAPAAPMVPGRPSVLLKMLTPRRYVDPAHARRVAGDLYGGAFRRDPALVERTLRHVRFSSRRGYYLQLLATLGWTSLPWLWTLRQPTLVMAGRDDPIVPTINSRLMQWLIPHARLALLDCGHLFLITLAAESARIVDAFLAEPRNAAPMRAAAHRSALPPSRRVA
jgi:poly(3-hydroxyalkanoate) depolymerase